MKQSKATILVCEDDTTLNGVVVDFLRSKGYAVVAAFDGEEGLAQVSTGNIDLCLVDVMMPKIGGLEMTKIMRDTGVRKPVILMSVHSTKEDILAGYKAGCDDYVTKPYTMDIMVAKIEALLRLSNYDINNAQVEFMLADVKFDSVRQNFGDKHLSTRENDLLLLLCQNKNKMVERGFILRNIWRVDDYFSARSLSVYIHHLRVLLENIPSIRILSVHGKGYKLVDDGDLDGE